MSDRARKLRQATLKVFAPKAVPVPNYGQYVGRSVSKVFIDPSSQLPRPFPGVVCSFRMPRKNYPWFLIEYDDGDSQEVSLAELLTILTDAADSTAIHAPATQVQAPEPPPAQQQQQQQRAAGEGKKRDQPAEPAPEHAGAGGAGKRPRVQPHQSGLPNTSAAAAVPRSCACRPSQAVSGGSGAAEAASRGGAEACAGGAVAVASLLAAAAATEQLLDPLSRWPSAAAADVTSPAAGGAGALQPAQQSQAALACAAGEAGGGCPAPAPVVVARRDEAGAVAAAAGQLPQAEGSGAVGSDQLGAATAALAARGAVHRDGEGWGTGPAQKALGQDRNAGAPTLGKLAGKARAQVGPSSSGRAAKKAKTAGQATASNAGGVARGAKARTTAAAGAKAAGARADGAAGAATAKAAGKGSGKAASKGISNAADKGNAKGAGEGSSKTAGKSSTQAAGKGSAQAAGKGSAQAAGKGSAKASTKTSTDAVGKAGTKAAAEGVTAKAPRSRPSKEAAVEVPPIGQRERREYAPGSEPWRSIPGFRIPVQLEQDLSHNARKAVADCKAKYYRRFRKAEVEEDERVTAAGGKGEKGETLTRRPDRVSESWMKKEGHAIHRDKVVGYVAGVAVNDGFYSRAELAVCGMHHLPVAGIEYVAADKAAKGVPPFAVSVVASGVYEDDGDHGQEFIYTGEGGNDLLGTRKQAMDQTLVRGNRALVGCIQLGIPVRVIRKNKDEAAPLGCVLVFDGLYDVVEYWSEPGLGGKLIFRYRLIRRPGQGPLLSQKVTWGGISAPKEVTAFNRQGIVDPDITGGTEALPIWAVNETEDGKIPPCSSLDRIPDQSRLKHAHLGVTEKQLEALHSEGWEPGVEYVARYIYTEGVPPPAPPVLPREFKGRPHDYIAKLNHQRLPYHQSKPGRPPTLTDCQPVVYECGPWCNCPLGKDCPQAASQAGLRYRLEVFRKSDGQGWGVRSLDMIPQWSFITMYYGEVFRAADYDSMMEDGYDGSYCTDMAMRPDVDWEGNRLETRGSAEHAKYVVCGLRKRNVGALLNHSCDPNVFVQPVLSEHHNEEMPGIAMFAMSDIMPFTELTWDYGEDYVEHQLNNACLCGTEECRSGV